MRIERGVLSDFAPVIFTVDHKAEIESLNEIVKEFCSVEKYEGTEIKAYAQNLRSFLEKIIDGKKDDSI